MEEEKNHSLYFSVNTISIRYDTDLDTYIEVNMVQDDQSPPNQIHVTNTNKNNGKKWRPPKRVNPEGKSGEGEDNNETVNILARLLLLCNGNSRYKITYVK
jgi:hypothetical protein